MLIFEAVTGMRVPYLGLWPDLRSGESFVGSSGVFNMAPSDGGEKVITDGAVVYLTGTSQNPGLETSDLSLATGIAYPWGVNDLSAPGDYHGEFRLTWASGLPEILPLSLGPILVRVRASI